jgi:hypothetical protein
LLALTAALKRNTTLTSLGLAANGLGEDERGFYWNRVHI